MTWFNAANAAEAHATLTRLGRDTEHPQVSTRHLGEVQSAGGDVTRDANDRLWSAQAARLTNEQEVELVRAAKAGDDQARLALLQAYTPLLKSLAAATAGSDFEDVRQAAVAGLFRAVAEAEDGERIRPRVIGAVREELHEMHYEHTLVTIPDRTRRRFAKILRDADGDAILAAELAPDAGMSPEVFWACYRSADFDGRTDAHTLAEGHHPAVEADYSNVDDRLAIAALMAGAGLDDRERVVVRALYDGATDAVTAGILGIDRTRVVHIRTAALAKMRQSAGAGEDA